MRYRLSFFLAYLSVSPVVAAEPEPPPATFAAKARILFQGDSITDMARGRGTDPNHVLGHSYVFLIAAKYGAAFPERELDFVNRGVGGNTVFDLEKRWQKDTLDLRPDLLSILIGVNDNKAVPIDQYEKVYDRLIAAAKAANPNLKLVLGEPFGLPVGPRKDSWAAWNDGLAKRRAVVAKLAKTHGAALVKYQRTFDETTKRAARRLLDLGRRSPDVPRSPDHGRRVGADRSRFLADAQKMTRGRGRESRPLAEKSGFKFRCKVKHVTPPGRSVDRLCELRNPVRHFDGECERVAVLSHGGETHDRVQPAPTSPTRSGRSPQGRGRR